MHYSYETIGTFSYLVATFEGGEGIINYQLQMLINNEIKNISAVNKSQLNDDVRLSYNITSRVALADMDESRKIPKIGVIHLIEGALDALKDVEEYQLASTGIVFDEKYIYVKPDTYEPSFIYLPCYTDDCGVSTLKDLLLSLVMGSKVEITNDTFVQTLLETLNAPGLSADSLRTLCEKFKSGSDTNSVKPKDRVISKEPVVSPVPPVSQTPPSPVRVIQMDNKTSQKAGTSSAKNSQVEKKNNKAEKTQKQQGSKKFVFILLQLLFVVVVAALCLNGMLNDANGNLVLEYLFGVVICVVAADFIIYREMFVNGKNNKTDNKSSNKVSKPAKTPSVAIPGKETSVKIPGKDIQPNYETNEKATNNVGAAPSSDMPAVSPTFVPPASTGVVAPAYNSVGDFESEATVLMGADGAVSGMPKVAYLEYFDKAKGGNSKIMLDKPAVVVGKLAGQCDVVINEQTISKVHAEFIVRNGEYFVKDYASTNGTYINGSADRIVSNTEYQIYGGDTVTLAGVDMVLKV